jgi:hypothetical protein
MVNDSLRCGNRFKLGVPVKRRRAMLASTPPRLDPDRRTFPAEFQDAMEQLAKLAQTQRTDEKVYLIEQTRALN